MERQRTTPTIQIPTYQQYLSNAVAFPAFPASPELSPSFVSGEAYLSPIDADRSLSDAFYALSLSPAAYGVPPPLYTGQIVAGEGYGSRHRWSEDTEALRRRYGANFDFGFDFDRKSNLESKKQKPFDNDITRCSSKLASLIADNKLMLKRLDDYAQFNINPSFSNLKSQSPSHSNSNSQSQNHEVMSPWCLKKLRGRIYTMAKDQNGCRILQAMFETPTLEEVEIVLSEVVGFVSDLMKDQFGNYLVQKLVVVCNDDQKMQLLRSLVKDIVVVCMNPHGTRAVQKLLENLQDLNQVKLVMKALHRGATTLATDPNGHHVIQYCLVNFPTDINMPILTEIANECYKIATDRSGCCVLQACVEHARGEVRTRIIAEIMANSVHLAEDPFGNYVLQHMVGLNVQELTALLVRQLQGHFALLSCNKYGSNVVEKCLNESREDISTRIVLELIGSPNASLLLVDPYANFVIQSALKVSKGFAHECLCGLISKNMWSMQTNLYGKKILGRFNKKKVNFA